MPSLTALSFPDNPSDGQVAHGQWAWNATTGAWIGFHQPDVNFSDYNTFLALILPLLDTYYVMKVMPDSITTPDGSDMYYYDRANHFAFFTP
jgi:hypothetical protein